MVEIKAKKYNEWEELHNSGRGMGSNQNNGQSNSNGSKNLVGLTNLIDSKSVEFSNIFSTMN